VTRFFRVTDDCLDASLISFFGIVTAIGDYRHGEKEETGAA
jgi:hypothetical protein